MLREALPLGPFCSICQSNAGFLVPCSNGGKTGDCEVWFHHLCAFLVAPTDAERNPVRLPLFFGAQLRGLGPLPRLPKVRRQAVSSTQTLTQRCCTDQLFLRRLSINYAGIFEYRNNKEGYFQEKLTPAEKAFIEGLKASESSAKTNSSDK